MGPGRCLAAAAGALALGAPSAYASQTWYTTPHPRSGATCAKANPCSLSVGLSDARNGDQVIVGSGDYGSASHPVVGGFATGESVYVHGASGTPRPRLFVTEPPNTGGTGLLLDGPQSKVSYLEIDDSAPVDIGLDLYGTVASRVLVRSPDTACELDGSPGGPGSPLLVDSLCIGGSVGVNFENVSNAAFTPTVRNVTAVASEDAFAVAAGANNATGDIDAEASNVIADGRIFTTSYTSAAASLSLSFSDYNPADVEGTAINDGENRSAPPRFVDAAAGNYREASGSPTIDRGANAPANGPFDLDGNVREIGHVTDMGAYEFVIAPRARTGGTSRLKPHSVRLNGSILNGAAAGAQWFFEWGTTRSLGRHETKVRLVGPSASFETVSAALAGLTAGKKYYYRLVAANPAGTRSGAIDSITTPLR